MRPDEKDAVLGAIGHRPEAVWLPWRDLVRRVGGRPDGIGKGVPVGGDLRGLGLFKVEMKRWSLENTDSAVNWRSSGGRWVGHSVVPEDGLCLSCSTGGHAYTSLALRPCSWHVNGPD
jgi:hypothetical protein